MRGPVTSVSVVVPTFRRPEALRLTLGALTAVDYPKDELELIVVDDAAEAVTATVVEAFQGVVRITLLEQDQSGAATARNTGARAAAGDLLLFLDDDMIVAPEHIDQHVRTHSAYQSAMVGSWRWYTDSALATLNATPFGRYRVALERRFMDELDEPSLGGDCSAAAVLAANDLSLARTAFEELGGFDEAYPHAGAEDQDLSIRARAAGMQLVRNRAIRPQHEEDIVTFAKFAWREERGGETVAVLARRYPEAIGRFGENAPPARGDSPGLVAKKVLKGAFARGPALAVLHTLIGILERVRAPEPVLHRFYEATIGLHIRRGYRRGFKRS
jgi:GT2 family glycosyltransferase